jgi:hypothetical protein
MDCPNSLPGCPWDDSAGDSHEAMDSGAASCRHELEFRNVRILPPGYILDCPVHQGVGEEMLVGPCSSSYYLFVLRATRKICSPFRPFGMQVIPGKLKSAL